MKQEMLSELPAKANLVYDLINIDIDWYKKQPSNNKLKIFFNLCPVFIPHKTFYCGPPQLKTLAPLDWFAVEAIKAILGIDNIEPQLFCTPFCCVQWWRFWLLSSISTLCSKFDTKNVDHSTYVALDVMSAISSGASILFKHYKMYLWGNWIL